MSESYVGERIRRVRRRLGMTQDELAERADISRSYVSLLESGQRALDDRALLYRLAHALKVSVQTLTGEPGNAGDPEIVEFNAAIPSIEAALNGAGNYDEPHPEPYALATCLVDTQRALDLRMAGQYAELGRLLPRLIQDLYVHAEMTNSPEAWRAVNQATFCTSQVVRALGHVSLSLVAASASESAAARLNDPVAIAASSYAMAQSLVSSSARRRSLNFTVGALQKITGLGDTDDGKQIAGMLHLQAALTFGSLHEEANAREHIVEAQSLSQVTGEGDAYALAFGPANVSLWEMSTHLEMRNAGKAVEVSSKIQPHAIRTNDRQSRFYIELARGHFQSKKQGEALGSILQAEIIAPHYTRTRTVVREMVGAMIRQERGRVEESPLGQLAVRVGPR